MQPNWWQKQTGLESYYVFHFKLSFDQEKEN